MSGHTDAPPTQRSRSTTREKYRDCLITPMTSDSNGKPLIKAEHLMDAFLVACVVLFSFILGDVFFSWVAGNPAYLTTDEILTRVPTAAVGAALTFFAQWLRARGIELKSVLWPGLFNDKK